MGNNNDKPLVTKKELGKGIITVASVAGKIPITGETVKTTMEIIGKMLYIFGEYEELPESLGKAKNKLI